MYIDGTQASEGFKVKLLDYILWRHKPWIIKSGDSLIASIDRNFSTAVTPTRSLCSICNLTKNWFFQLFVQLILSTLADNNIVV